MLTQEVSCLVPIEPPRGSADPRSRARPRRPSFGTSRTSGRRTAWLARQPQREVQVIGGPNVTQRVKAQHPEAQLDRSIPELRATLRA